MRTVKGRASFGFQYAKIFTIFLLFLLFSAPSLSAATSYSWVRSVSNNLSAPTAVALDSDENLYVVESSTNKLLVYSRGGEYIRKLTGLNKPVSVGLMKGEGSLSATQAVGMWKYMELTSSQFSNWAQGTGSFCFPPGLP